MTERERQECIAKGYLWYDTEEFLAHQAKIKDLMYEFNLSRPSEKELRDQLMRKMFGSVGENVWINQPLNLTVGETVTIGNGKMQYVFVSDHDWRWCMDLCRRDDPAWHYDRKLCGNRSRKCGNRRCP